MQLLLGIITDQEKALLLAEGFVVWTLLLAGFVTVFSSGVPGTIKVAVAVAMLGLVYYIKNNHQDRVRRLFE